MPEPMPTLQTIFRVTHDEATDAILAGVDTKIWREIALPQMLVKAAAAKVSKGVDGLLTIPLPDILCGAWNAYRKYCKYADPKGYPPGTEHEEREGPFAVESKHTPHIDLLINGKVRATVNFPITLTLNFDGATVVVRDGQFTALKSGSCTVAGKICCETAVLKELKSSPLILPGVLNFGKGIPILPCH